MATWILTCLPLAVAGHTFEIYVVKVFSPGLPWSHSLWYQPWKCWNYRHVPPSCCHCDRYLVKTMSGRRGSFWSSLRVQSTMVGKTWSRSLKQLTTSYLQPGSRERWILALSLLFPFMQIRLQSVGWHCPHLGCVPPQPNPETCTTTCLQGDSKLCQVDISINYYTQLGLPSQILQKK